MIQLLAQSPISLLSPNYNQCMHVVIVLNCCHKGCEFGFDGNHFFHGGGGWYKGFCQQYFNCPTTEVIQVKIIQKCPAYFRCEKMLISSVTPSNCIKFYQTAEDIGAKELQIYCTEIISNHWVSFIREILSSQIKLTQNYIYLL